MDLSETTPLIGRKNPPPAPVQKRRRNRKSPSVEDFDTGGFRSFSSQLIALAGILLVGIFAVLPIQMTRKYNMNGPHSSALRSSNLVEIDDSDLDFRLHNKYTYRDGPAGKLYPWLEGKLLAEPYQQSFLEVTDPQPGKAYQFHLVNQNTGHVRVVEGTQAPVTFGSLDPVLVTLKEYSSADVLQAGPDGPVAGRSSTKPVVVKYVRREVRALDAADREATLDAMKAVYSLSGDAGRERYGDNFRSAVELLKYHLLLAGDRVCDHMHDGFGFLGHHAALTALMEEAMQAVNPRVAMPYWEYVRDIEDWDRAQEAREAQGLPVQPFTNWGVMTADFFGGTDETGRIKDGRWKDLRIPKLEDIPEEDQDGMPHNAFGYMRSPWSNNESPYLLRSSETCGTIPRDDLSGRCQALNILTTEQASLEEWMKYASYAPHGRVHLLLGGTMECGKQYDRLAGVLSDEDLEEMRTISFAFHKNLFRDDILACDQESKCYCPHYDEYMESRQKANGILQYMGTAELGRFYNQLEWEDLQTLIDVVCNSGLIYGDQMQASSSMSPEFWPIHPAMERLFQYKALAYPFEDATYPDYGTWITYKNTDYCWGHGADELVLNGHAHVTVEGEKRFLTNQQYVEVLSPERDGGLSYIYDNHEYSFCEDTGYPF
mmetsp:Transcript_7468/g.10443  ORF Transcript_7468/g.10443 Transcript_7468/m.10443 type:complete len:658 (+) Transcript_7468:149-2122(+)